MKKKIFGYTICAAVALILAGCAKFLDVNPKGEVFDADMFNSAAGYEDALFGVYSEIASSEKLYAGNLNWTPEALSGNFTAVGDYIFGYMALGNWYSQGPAGVGDGIWKEAYKAINHVNNIISHAEADGDRFPHSELYRGEALALRALLHFELVRLFGAPWWAEAKFKAEAIPYVEKYSFDITPPSSLDEVYSKIVRDLKEAEICLAEDASLLPVERDNVATGFTSCRITHLNLYAVQALLARVYWTMNDLPKAEEYALKVISCGKFSFRPTSAFIQPDNGTLDLNETVFGLYSSGNASTNFQWRMSTKYKLRGASTRAFELASDWRTLYEEGASSSKSDYRLSAWFNDTDQTMTKIVNPVFYSSSEGTSYAGKSILGCNILRLPELYFIVAEANLTSDPAKAVQYFDKVITTRGLDAFAQTGETLTLERLNLERRKEFYGEAYSWFVMKQQGVDIHTTAGTTLDGKNPATYTMPIPVSESEGINGI